MYSRSKIGNPVRGMRRRSYATASRSENVARRLGELNRMIAARSVQRAFRSNYGYMPVDAPERLRYPSGREMIDALARDIDENPQYLSQAGKRGRITHYFRSVRSRG